MNETLRKIASNFRDGHGNIITLLQETQEAFGYVPREAVEYFSEELCIAPSRIYGVATFYAQFHLTPRGKNIITACCGTACHVKGSERLLNGIIRELGLGEGESTTSDMEFTLEKVNCVGACSIAPVVIVNEKVFGKVTSDRMKTELKRIRDKEDAG